MSFLLLEVFELEARLPCICDVLNWVLTLSRLRLSGKNIPFQIHFKYPIRRYWNKLELVHSRHVICYYTMISFIPTSSIQTQHIYVILSFKVNTRQSMPCWEIFPYLNREAEWSRMGKKVAREQLLSFCQLPHWVSF